MNKTNPINYYKNAPQQIKASLWFMICGFIQKGISLLTTPIFSRLMSTSEYGIFNVFLSWQSIILIFSSLNLASGVYVRGLIKYNKDQEEFTASLQSLFVLVSLIVFAIYIFLSPFWNSIFELPTAYVCVIFIDGLFGMAFNFWSARQRVMYKYRALVLLTVTNAVIKSLVGIYLVSICQDKVSARIYSALAIDALILGYLFFKMFFHKGKVISTKYWRYALKYNIPLVPHYLSQIVLNQSDRIMIKKLVDSSKAGIYSLAYSVAAVLTIINQSILNTYNPWMYQKIRDKEYKDIGKVSYILLTMISLINLALIICAPEAIAIIAPQKYYEARWIIPPVSMSVFFMFMYSLFANFEFYFEKTKYMMIASVLGASLNVLLNFIFIKRFGYMAAGYTTLVCYICYCFAHYFLMKSILKKNLPNEKIYDMRIILLISVVFVVVGSMSLILYNYPIIRYSIIGIGLIISVLMHKKISRVLKIIIEMKSSQRK